MPKSHPELLHCLQVAKRSDSAQEVGCDRGRAGISKPIDYHIVDIEVGMQGTVVRHVARSRQRSVFATQCWRMDRGVRLSRTLAGGALQEIETKKLASGGNKARRHCAEGLACIHTTVGAVNNS